jgi:FAD-dependent urate hydroxylase
LQRVDVVIVGAGPYGLSAAAHLRAVPGLRVRVFGEPMSFWQRNMPGGMLLRSPWDATHIAGPRGTLKLEAYTAARGNHVPSPIPLERFVDYGLWFQQQAVPDLDRRKIVRIQKAPQGFQVKLEDGEVLHSARVVIAAGIAAFAWRPPEFQDLPRQLASHSCDHSDLACFGGKRVLVVGGGQSALENGALLHEFGADVEILVRHPVVHWLGWKGRISRIKPLARLLYSPRDVGPAGLSQLVARPNYFQKLPGGIQDWTHRRSIRPAGAGWLRGRLNNVKISPGVCVKSAVPGSGRLRVASSDGAERLVDHLLFATGYRIDISRYSFLSSQLLDDIDRVGGYPQLNSGFESSVPGLYFLGAPGAASFGPLLRFVSGTYYAVEALARNITARP